MNFLDIKDFSKEQIQKLVERAIEFKNGASLKINDTVANIFIEPSTRTLLSFKKAQSNLGMEVYDLHVESSSFKKGESLEDTLLNLKAMGINNFVIRTREEGYWKNFKEKFNFANAGDGTKNHPSQALLDAVTIYEKFGTLENLKIAIVGDTKHSRVYHSNKELLEKFGSTVEAFGPAELNGVERKIEEEISNFDVVMLLRIQHERHEVTYTDDTYNIAHGLNADNVKLMKEDSIILHPGPLNRGVEITEDLLYDHPKNKILNQVENGVYTRMAIMEMICKNT